MDCVPLSLDEFLTMSQQGNRMAKVNSLMNRSGIMDMTLSDNQFSLELKKIMYSMEKLNNVLVKYSEYGYKNIVIDNQDKYYQNYYAQRSH